MLKHHKSTIRPRDQQMSTNSLCLVMTVSGFIITFETYIVASRAGRNVHNEIPFYCGVQFGPRAVSRPAVVTKIAFTSIVGAVPCSRDKRRRRSCSLAKPSKKAQAKKTMNPSHGELTQLVGSSGIEECRTTSHDLTRGGAMWFLMTA